jgi:DNA polymerase/3'-5' exonuclease PolX
MKYEKKWPWEIAMPEAEAIVERLKPCCERIAVAGSLRRLKRFVGDIEIVFVPKMSKRPDGLFDEKIISVANEVIERLLEDGYFQKRPNEKGAFTWGEKNKLAVHTASGIPVDLFSEFDPLEWWRTLVIRTGPKMFNIELMATGPKVGVIPHAYNIGLTNAKDERIIVNSEREFIERCGVKYLQPKDR